MELIIELWLDSYTMYLRTVGMLTHFINTQRRWHASYVTGFAKTNLIVTFSISKNTDLKC